MSLTGLSCSPTERTDRDGEGGGDVIVCGDVVVEVLESVRVSEWRSSVSVRVKNMSNRSKEKII